MEKRRIYAVSVFRLLLSVFERFCFSIKKECAFLTTFLEVQSALNTMLHIDKDFAQKFW